MFKRIFSVFHARNLEFLRDRASLTMNIAMPVLLVFGLAVVFGSGDRTKFTVGVLQHGADINVEQHPFLKTRYVHFVPETDREAAIRKIARHQLDLLVEFSHPAHYWVNPDSAGGYFMERVLLQSENAPAVTSMHFEKQNITGRAVRYVDWVLPGILGMNMMFSCLLGVGYVVVRYRKNGFLKRLRATPLSALEFIIAQVASRLVLIMSITTAVFMATHLILHTQMEGSYWTLLLVAILGAISMISLGLLIAARVNSEELAGGLLNIISWPMMLLSGVWFSLEGAGKVVRHLASLLPLTQLLDAARAVIIDGATIVDVAPHLLALAAMSMFFLGLGAVSFRWRPQGLG